jgi:hypothetical protein
LEKATREYTIEIEGKIKNQLKKFFPASSRNQLGGRKRWPQAMVRLASSFYCLFFWIA